MNEITCNYVMKSHLVTKCLQKLSFICLMLKSQHGIAVLRTKNKRKKTHKNATVLVKYLDMRKYDNKIFLHLQLHKVFIFFQ